MLTFVLCLISFGFLTLCIKEWKSIDSFLLKNDKIYNRLERTLRLGTFCYLALPMLIGLALLATGQLSLIIAFIICASYCSFWTIYFINTDRKA